MFKLTWKNVFSNLKTMPKSILKIHFAMICFSKPCSIEKCYLSDHVHKCYYEGK